MASRSRADFSVVDFALAFGGEIGAGAHGERGGDHAGEAGEEHVFGIAGCGAGDAGDDAEDGAKAVVDAVDGVADPRAGLLAARVALGQHLFEDGFGIDFGRAGGGGVVAADERTQLAIVVFLVLDDVLEDGDGAFVAESLELFAIAGDVAALFDFEAAERHAHATGAVGERVGLAAGTAGVDRLGSAQLLDAPFP